MLGSLKSLAPISSLIIVSNMKGINTPAIMKTDKEMCLLHFLNTGYNGTSNTNANKDPKRK